MKKSIPRCPLKKDRKKQTKNRFGDQFWTPKPLQNPRKILSKTMLDKEAKKKRKNCPQDPTWETCLSKEREERKCFRAVEACNLKLENRCEKKTRKKGSKSRNTG